MDVIELDSHYRQLVVDLLTAQLVGDLDGDTPRVTIERVVDTTVGSSAGSVLRLDVRTRVDQKSDEISNVFEYREWEEYEDQSPESMAEGLAVLIRTDIREEIAIQRP